MKKIESVFGLCLALTTACTAADDASEGAAPQELQALKAIDEDNQLPGTIVDVDGRRWTCQDKARYTVVEDGKFARPEADLDEALALDTASNLTSRSIDEIAEALRSVTEIGGYECISDPDYELAKKVKEGFGAGMRIEGSVGKLEMPGTDKDPCCGTDNRFGYGAGGWRNTLLLSEVGCTAFFIHPSVAITAAHCLYDTVANAFLRVPDGAGGMRAPRYRNDTDGGGGPFTTLTCWRSNVPAAYKNATSSLLEHDYGFIDFSSTSTTACSDPTPAPQWLGQWVASNNDLTTSVGAYRLGYPAGTNLSANICLPLTNNYTTTNGCVVDAAAFAASWVASPAGFGTPSNGFELNHPLDASPGDSGSPTLAYYSPWGLWYMVSHHSRAACSASGQVSDRRFNSTVFNWVTANTPY